VSSPEERLQEYASISAGHAANALAGLLDQVVLMDPPSCRWLKLADIAASVFQPEEWIAAVFADLSGPTRGQLGLLLERQVAGEVLRRMVGSKPGGELDAAQASALAELGNITLSAAAGALGALYQGVVMPSIPRIGYDMAGALLVEALHERIAQLPAYLMEAALADRARSLRARLVWVPEP
jgi:chemotaxis protein CheC